MCDDGGLILITYGEKIITHVHLTHVMVHASHIC